MADGSLWRAWAQTLGAALGGLALGGGLGLLIGIGFGVSRRAASRAALSLEVLKPIPPVARRIEVRAFRFALLPQLVVGTDRIATLQTRLARLYARTLPLRLLEPPLACPKLTEVLQWNRYRDQDPGIAWLRARMLDAAEPVARATAGRPR